MAKYAYERLSAQDAGFLWAEKPNQPMHVGAVAILDAEPLRTPEGCLDIDRYRSQVESVLHWIPRYRQRLEWTPIDRWPVWVDDRQFDLNYHIRHIALPRPGTLAQLKELAGRITARALDRRHALWEIWVIEGVSGGEQYALINKIHHCMIDGAAGADLAQILMSPSPQMPDSDPVPYMPRPVPTPAELFRDSVSLGLSRPFEVMRKRLDAITRSPLERTTLDGGGRRAAGAPSLERRLRAFGAMMEATLGKASATPLNGELSPHRRVEWITMPLDDVKECGKGLRSTINDVVLATVTEAVRRYFFRRRVDCRDLDFRISAPVSVRKDLHDRRQGNHVSSWVVSLPIALTDPLEQLAEIQFQTEKLKNSEAALAIEALTDFAEWLPASVLSRVVGGHAGFRTHQRNRDERARPSIPAVHRGVETARSLSDGAAAAGLRPGDRAVQLRGQAVLGIQRRLRTRPRPARLHGGSRNGVRSASRRGGHGVSGAANVEAIHASI